MNDDVLLNRLRYIVIIILVRFALADFNLQFGLANWFLPIAVVVLLVASSGEVDGSWYCKVERFAVRVLRCSPRARLG